MRTDTHQFTSCGIFINCQKCISVLLLEHKIKLRSFRIDENFPYNVESRKRAIPTAWLKQGLSSPHTSSQAHVLSLLLNFQIPSL